MSAPLDLDVLIATILGDTVRVRTTRFPSGAVSIDAWCGEHFASIDSFPASAQWGVSVDTPDDEGFTGHDQVFPSAREALEAARRLLIDAAASSG